MELSSHEALDQLVNHWFITECAYGVSIKLGPEHWADRLFIYLGTPLFVKLRSPGEPEDLQQGEHVARLRRAGCHVVVISDAETGIGKLEEFLR